MKPLLLPLTLISFTVLCLSLLHIENINTLENTSNTLRKKQEDYSTKEISEETYQVNKETILELQ